jgi:hypothetical protein
MTPGDLQSALTSTPIYAMFSFGSKRHSSVATHHATYQSHPPPGQRHQSVKYPPGYHQQQQQQQQHYGPPQGADPQLWQWFVNVDRDRSGSITVDELQSALVNGEQYRLFHHMLLIFAPPRRLDS